MDFFDFVIGDVHGIRVKELADHKAKGGKVAASFCVFVPDEVIIAAGGASVGLCAGAQFPIATAEKVLPRNICPLIKASIGFKLDRICPYFQVSDFVVGETTCDGKKKAWEILDEFIPTYVMELPVRFTEKVNALCDELEERITRGEGAVPKGTPRILATGSPQPIPSWKLHAVIENSGAVVVCEETCTGTRYFEAAVREDSSSVDEQLTAVAERGMSINCACFTPNDKRVEDVARLAREYNEDMGQLQTRVQAFLEMLGK